MARRFLLWWVSTGTALVGVNRWLARGSAGQRPALPDIVRRRARRRYRWAARYNDRVADIVQLPSLVPIC